MGMNWAEHSEEIDAPVELCFEAIVDYESFGGWQDAVDSVEVLSRTAEGIGEDVRLFVDAKVRKIDYVLRYRYERPTLIEWDFVEGNGMRAMDGHYAFEPLGPERTRATYKLGADPAIPVPGMVLRRTHKQLVKRSVEDLKREAERRHAAGESPAPVEPAPAAESEPAAGPDPEPTGVSIGSDPLSELAAASGRDEAGERTGDDWVPKAAREPVGSAPGAGGGRPRTGHSSGGSRSHADLAALPLELAGQAVKVGREVADGAIRAGTAAAGQAIGIGRKLARRIRDG